MISPDTEARRQFVHERQASLRWRRGGTRQAAMRFIAPALIVVACAVLAHSAAGAATDRKAFGATFVESRVSTTDRIADLGVLQFVNTGTGTVEGRGPATVVLAMSQDRSVQPCGPGSSTNAGTRRIVVGDGVLVLRTVAYVCLTSDGPRATGSWTVDGGSSTGVFAGARGSGEESVDIPTRTATLTGKLWLAHEGA